MALAKQLVPLSIAQGIDTKTDPKQLSLNALLKVQNAIYDEIGMLKKRKGYDQLQLRDVAENLIQNPAHLAKFKEELLLFTDRALYSRSGILERFVEKGVFYSVFPKTKQVARAAQSLTEPDSIIVENFKVFAYTVGSGGIRYSVLDTRTNTFTASFDEISATGIRPNVAAIQNTVYILYIEGSNLLYRSFSILEPTVLSAPVTMATNVNASNKRLDAYSGTDRVFFAYNSNAVTNRLSVGYIDNTGTVSSILSVAGENCDKAVDVYVDSQFRVVVSYSDNVAAKYVMLPYTLLTTIAGPFTLETIADVRNVSVVECDTNEYCFFFEVGAVNALNHYVKRIDGTPTGSLSGLRVLARSVGLGSKPFLHDSQIFVFATIGSTQQSTYLVLDDSGSVVCRLSSGTGGGHYSQGSLPRVFEVEADVFHAPTLVKSKFASEAGTFFSVTGVNAFDIDFSETEPFQNEVLANNLHLAGGVLQMYDGDNVVEHGFHVYPEGIAAGSTATVGGAMSDGSYGYVAVYRWTDSFGQDHRSAPSENLEVTLVGGTSTQVQNVIVPTLRLTEKTGVVIELYRTEDAGTLYYLVTSINSPTLNDASVDTVTILDTLSDAQLIAREPLYTTGGVLENIIATSARVVSSFQNRVVLADGEDENLITYSKVRQEGFPVEFNDALIIRVKDPGGKVTAVVEYGEKMIIFKERATYFVSGDGPNNLGEQDNFTEPEQISVDVGCIDRDSLVISPDGLFFKSAKGIYMLDAGLNLSYVGDAVEDFNELTITSAKILPNVNQIRFTTLEGECLVYNYYVKRWSTFTNHRAKSAEIVGNVYYYLRPDGELWVESSGYADNGSAIKILIETGWISFADIQAFQRVYKLLLLGSYKSQHLLKLSCAYDFAEAFSQETMINPLDFIDPAAYGQYSPYGSEPVYGGDGNVYQARIFLKKQKCQSIKFRLEDVQATASEGLTLSAVTFEVGVKQGLGKVSRTKSYGTS